MRLVTRSIDCIAPAAWHDMIVVIGGIMFGFGSNAAAVRERAGKVRLLVAMIASNFYTKSADEFVQFYESTTVVERVGPEIYFGVNLSPSCWYDVQARYPDADPPWMNHLLGERDTTDEPLRSLHFLGAEMTTACSSVRSGLTTAHQLNFTSHRGTTAGRMPRPW